MLIDIKISISCPEQPTMKSEEVITCNPKDISAFQDIVNLSIRNALLSISFFGQSFNSENVVHQVTQKIKDQICLRILALYAKENQLEITFQHDQRTSWKSLQYDFTYQNIEWNFIANSILSVENLAPSEILKLPALVPNRFESDLWNERLKDPNIRRKFLFGFTLEKEWIDFREAIPAILTLERLAYLKKTSYENLGRNPASKSFNENAFWTELEKAGQIPKIHFSNIPTLIICGIAGEKEFTFFADTDSDLAHGYSLFTGKYYEHIPGGGLSFLKGIIKTEFRNATCPMQSLPSFQSTIQAQ